MEAVMLDAWRDSNQLPATAPPTPQKLGLCPSSSSSVTTAPLPMAPATNTWHNGVIRGSLLPASSVPVLGQTHFPANGAAKLPAAWPGCFPGTRASSPLSASMPRAMWLDSNPPQPLAARTQFEFKCIPAETLGSCVRVESGERFARNRSASPVSQPLPMAIASRSPMHQASSRGQVSSKEQSYPFVKQQFPAMDLISENVRLRSELAASEERYCNLQNKISHMGTHARIGDEKFTDGSMHTAQGRASTGSPYQQAVALQSKCISLGRKVVHVDI